MSKSNGQKQQNMKAEAPWRDESIRHIGFYSGPIETIGYDPQRAILEIKLMNEGKVRQYSGVPEEIWYGLRGNVHPDVYFRGHICGCYAESIVPAGQEESV